MIKRVYHLADIHVRNYHRMEEYAEQLEKIRAYIDEDVRNIGKEECRIVISGDIVDSKTSVSNELYTFVSTFIRQLEQICEVIIISGNHDQIVGNNSRIDTLSGIFTTANFMNAVYLDSYLGYDSGIVIEDNITWALFSIFSDFKRPDIEQARADYPNNVVVGLFHGAIAGSSLNNGTVLDKGTDVDLFKGCDYVMAGDIHKRQIIRRGGCEIVYPGSLIQQTFGETVTQHGIIVWDFEEVDGKNKVSYKPVDFDNDYALYDFEIKSPEDIDSNKEILLNY